MCHGLQQAALATRHTVPGPISSVIVRTSPATIPCFEIKKQTRQAGCLAGCFQRQRAVHAGQLQVCAAQTANFYKWTSPGKAPCHAEFLSDFPSVDSHISGPETRDLHLISSQIHLMYCLFFNHIIGGGAHACSIVHAVASTSTC